MEQTSMTALVSAFARAYHAEMHTVTVFNDTLAKILLGDADYQHIADNMANGIRYFNPAFIGTKAEALRWIVDHCLAPSPLGRAAYTETALQTAVRLGTTQYLIFAAGYDTFAYRQPSWANNLQIFEFDTPSMLHDKQRRLGNANCTIPNNVHSIAADLVTTKWIQTLLEHPVFDPEAIGFCSLLGLSYYLSKQTWQSLLSALGRLLPEGSTLVFDYPEETGFIEQTNAPIQKQAQLADAANETMRARYSYPELEHLLSTAGFLIYEHLTPPEITAQYFESYNQASTYPMQALESVNYCLAVRKHSGC
ncbi:MAG: class I SAM-dependent methyltransferase [Oscillospiraceae bacterium]|jgi:methyltransferase (TIGR00027 family)